MKKTRSIIGMLVGVGLLFSVTSAVTVNQDIPSTEDPQETVIQEEAQKFLRCISDFAPSF